MSFDNGNFQTIKAVIRFAQQFNYFSEIDDVLYYFEKWWKFQDLWLIYLKYHNEPNNEELHEKISNEIDSYG